MWQLMKRFQGKYFEGIHTAAAINSHNVTTRNVMIQLDTSATKPADLRGPLFVRTGKIVYKQLV